MTPNQRRQVPYLYESGLSTTQIATRFGVTDTAIWGLLKRRGTTIRTMSASHTRYLCDHAFFDVINCEDKAYWLGFLAADGHISIRKHCAPVLTLTLAGTETHHIERFRQVLRAGHPIRSYVTLSGHPYARLAISSAILCGALARLGVTPGKRKRLGFPRVPPELLHHFMRGYFDGDGSITRPTIKNPSFRVTGYLNFISEYQCHLVSACSLNVTNLAWRLGTPSLVYVGRHQVRRIRDFLYCNATVYLTRKKQRFDAL